MTVTEAFMINYNTVKDLRTSLYETHKPEGMYMCTLKLILSNTYLYQWI